MYFWAFSFPLQGLGFCFSLLPFLALSNSALMQTKQAEVEEQVPCMSHPSPWLLCLGNQLRCHKSCPYHFDAKTIKKLIDQRLIDTFSYYIAVWNTFKVYWGKHHYPFLNIHFWGLVKVIGKILITGRRMSFNYWSKLS